MSCREKYSFKDILERYLCEDKNEVHDMLTKANIQTQIMS
jgi:hypothetical protein